ncbi:hypothetical protein K3495_g12779 [Podosphaera aphanis]|nr:hypothetical protein K3495_g12779 [Podosphaera aphanis]
MSQPGETRDIKDEEDDVITREILLQVLEELGLQPQILIRALDAQYWGQSITKVNNTTAKQLTTFAVGCAISYKTSTIVDDELIGSFCDDFDGWSIEMFDKILRDVKRMLRLLLQRGGINTVSIRAGIARQLASVLQFEELPEWNDNDLVTTDLLSRSRFYQKKLRLLNSTNSQAAPPQPTRTPPDTTRRAPRVSYLTPAAHNVVCEQPEPSYISTRESQHPQPQPSLNQSRSMQLFMSSTTCLASEMLLDPCVDTN